VAAGEAGSRAGNPVIVTLPSVSSPSNTVSVAPRRDAVLSATDFDVVPPRTGPSDTGLGRHHELVAPEVAMLPPSLVVPTTLSVKFAWSPVTLI